MKPHVQMFDPGWRTKPRGWPHRMPPEDKGTVDHGNDPEGLLKRCIALQLPVPPSTKRIAGKAWHRSS